MPPPPSFLATLSGRRRFWTDLPRGGIWVDNAGHQMQRHLPAQDLTLRSGQPEMLLPPNLHASAFTCPRNELCPQHPLSAAVGRGALCV